MTAVFSAGSDRLSPGRRLGRGGEGEVFALTDGSPRALKIYASPDCEREEKVRAMAAAGLAGLCPGVAFPEAPAYAADGSFVGFVMPLVDEGHPVHELCSPGSRRRAFPNADWRFLVRTAVNTARVIERVHAIGAVVGDLNGSGVLVSNRAVVSLIDADSFQYGIEHPCRVGVPEFTPPELQGRSLNGVARTVEHDAFGLAVLIFQLLFLGRHPHAGVPKGRELPLVDAIGQNCFAYSRLRPVRLAPPRGTLLLDDVPLGLATLFERAFLGCDQRPLPREWITELESLEAGMVPCLRKEAHHRPIGSSGCPWCRIERVIGAPTFGLGAPAAGGPRPSGPVGPAWTEATRVLSRAKTEAGEGAQPSASPHSPMPSGTAVSVLERFGLPAVRGGDGRRILPAQNGVAKRLVLNHREARRIMDGAIDAWRDRVGAWTVARSAAALQGETVMHVPSTINEHVALARVKHRLTERLVLEELKRLPLTAAAVPGLGDRGMARLASAGITHASDVVRATLEAVPGIGERVTTGLLLWRDVSAVAAGRGVALDPTAVTAALKAFRTRSVGEEARRGERLNRLSKDLEVALDELAVRSQRPDRLVEAAVAAYRQALADLRHLGLPEHDVPEGPTATPPGPAPKASKPGGAACPVCGGSMVKRWARGGTSPNSYFLGCSSYPTCTGSRTLRSRRP